MSAYSIFVLLHVSAGALALVTFWLAASLRKGSPRHRLVGRTYLLAMVVVLASGVPLTLQRLLDGRPVGAAFLGYLLLLAGTTVWLSWRSIRDRQHPARYTGRAYRMLALANPLAGLAVLAVGLAYRQPLLVGFSLVGILLGADMLRRRRLIGQQPSWWLEEHYGAMVGNAAATHVAFLSIGLPRLLPGLQGPVAFYLAWFAPVLLAVLARIWLNRRYRPSPVLPRTAPVPRA
ncbi:hypothetical protein CO641_10500 [Lysobacteraceae bacterium NML91-0213]|nr:hypothetical protein CO641_10500 [Xanthomonadaceae bacterium NML91-0213]